MRLVSLLLDCLVPPACIACKVSVGRARAFCAGCAGSVERIVGAQPVAELSVHAGFVYGGALRSALLAWKFHGDVGVGRVLCELFAASLGLPALAAYDLLVPVPSHVQRLAERGFNPPSALGRALAATLRCSFAPLALQRRKASPAQSKLGAGARLDNVRAAFEARRSLQGRRVLLVDDVCTTGATLAACRQAALQAGADQVGAAVLALASPHRHELAHPPTT